MSLRKPIQKPQFNIGFQSRCFSLFIYCHLYLFIPVCSLNISANFPLIFARFIFFYLYRVWLLFYICPSFVSVIASLCLDWLTDWLTDRFLFILFAELDLNKRLTLTSYCFCFMTKALVLYWFSQETESQRKHKPSNEVLGPRWVPITRKKKKFTLLINSYINLQSQWFWLWWMDLFVFSLTS